MTKIILEGYIEVPKEDLETVIQELPVHIKLTRQESGCILFEVKRDDEMPNRLNVYEEFENQEAFDFHQRRVKESHWYRITQNVKRNYNIKRV